MPPMKRLVQLIRGRLLFFEKRRYFLCMFDPPDTFTSERAPVSWRQRGLEAGLIIAFWSLLILITIGRHLVDPRGAIAMTMSQMLPVVLEYGLWALLTPAVFWLSRHLSLKRIRLRYAGLHIFVALGVSIGIDFLGHEAYESWWAEGGQGSTYNLRYLLFLDELIIYLTVLSIGFARAYYFEYRARREEAVHLQAQAARLQAQLAQARLETLRMQLNPHFLFNTLHAVSTLIERDPGGARRMIARLSDLLRYTLDGANEREVPLAQEVRVLSDYLEIEQIRFQGTLEIQQEIDPAVLEALVPPLILQPLVENALKHGVGKVEGTGRVEVRGWREGEALYLTVRDNGPGLSEEDARPPGIGLSNARARLQQLYGPAHHLTLHTPAEGGLAVQIKLPYHTPADLRATALLKPEPVEEA